MTSNKKDDHLKLAHQFHGEERISDFDNIKFVHHSFPEISIDDIYISTRFANLDIPFPFYINAMTGGSDMTKDINEKLAIVAREVNIPMASGSLSVAVKNSDLEDSFRIIRKSNPNGIIFANLGAEHNIENAKKAIDILDANAFQIHINSTQELVMPEGDRDFSNWHSSIEYLVNNLDANIIVKEVGFGMSRETVEQLISLGVQTIDISGSGGTNFSKIENFRRTEFKYDYLEDYGQSTVISLLEANPFVHKYEILASGGIRNPLDIVKALSLGARSVGIAGTILDMVLNLGVDKTIEELNNWKYQIKMIMTLLGKKNIYELQNTDIIIKNDVRDWCKVRDIDYKSFGVRGRKKD